MKPILQYVSSIIAVISFTDIAFFCSPARNALATDPVVGIEWDASTMRLLQQGAIRMSVSSDKGQTWQPRPEPIYVAGNTECTGCWEPAAVQMPDGELRLLLAHELPGEQEIVMMTSVDGGYTWSPPRQVSLRPGFRDGMPVPTLLADGRFVFAIEDNGAAPQTAGARRFRPTIVDPDSASRWMALSELPPPSSNLAAPYLVRLQSGETLLSVQSNEDDPKRHRMAVYVGNREAKDFARRTLPFGLPRDANCNWNSLHIVDEDHVIAISNTTIQGQGGLWTVTGRVVRDLRSTSPGRD